MKFLKLKYGLEKPEEKPPAPPVEAKVTVPAEKPPKPAGIRAFDVYIGDEYYRVEVAPARREARTALVTPPSPTEKPAPAVVEKEAVKEKPATPTVAVGEAAILAPLPGLVIRYEVKEGDRVNEGDAVVVFEAMKMQSTLSAPRDGIIKALTCSPGEKVSKGAVLAIIS